MSVYIDIGNTRIKWKLVSGAEVKSGFVNDNCGNIWECFEHLKFSEFVVASVADSRILESLYQWAKPRNLSVYVAKVMDDFLGLKVAYSKLQNLGIDRWLSMHALASTNNYPTLVISAGTAITVDAIDRHKHHLGGLIAPGMNLMLNALVQNTYAINLDRILIDGDWRLGRDTSECVEGGVKALVSGFVKAIISDPKYNDFSLVFTGGNAEQLMQYCDKPAHRIETLVLDGLQVVHENGGTHVYRE